MSSAVARRSLLWLFAALIVVILPHLEYLPLWLSIVLTVSLVWRFRVYQGRWSMPVAPVRWALVVASVALLALDFRRLIGLEPTTSALVLACALKTLELRDQRDYLVIVFAAYFLAASQLLFSQEISDAIVSLAGVVALTAALIARHQGEPSAGFPNPLMLAVKLLSQALPLMFVLFLVFPRLPPLWAIPQQSSQARTGPSDTMSPGDFARLGGSDEVAFRVTFDGEPPLRSDMYWRGMVFSEFDGRTWRQGTRHRMENYIVQNARRQPIELPAVELGETRTRYEIVLEPTQQNWAYVLGYPLQFDDSLRQGSDARLVAVRKVNQRLKYTVYAALDYVLEPELRELSRAGYLQLPKDFNPRTSELAERWRDEASSDREYLQRVLRWYGQEAFVYTLEPGSLGRDSVDEFLFESRRGFCEHYAGSFVYLMRAAGIPARVVAGYQGATRNNQQDYWVVHQFDAHAWAEVWLDGAGWVRVDPTSAVSPLRIESGLEDAVGSEFLANAPLSLKRFSGVPFAAWWDMQWDMINYQWAKLVLQYDDERQMSVLNGLLGKVTTTRLATVLLGCGLLVMAYVSLGLFGWRRHNRHDKSTALYLRACAVMARRGVVRDNGEGPASYALRVEAEHAIGASDFRRLTDLYLSLCYRQPKPIAEGALFMEFRRRVRRLEREWRRRGVKY